MWKGERELSVARATAILVLQRLQLLVDGVEQRPIERADFSARCLKGRRELSL